MEVILILVGASLFVAIGFLIAYLWAVKTGQFNDKHTPAIRILFEDKLINMKQNQENINEY